MDCMRNGIKMGKQIRREMYEHEHGEKHGLSEGWYEDGRLWWHEIWENGNFNSSERTWEIDKEKWRILCKRMEQCGLTLGESRRLRLRHP